MRSFHSKITFTIFISILSFRVQAQDTGTWSLPIGSGSGQVGLISMPNEECRGPTAITPASDGRLAILDEVNQKIVVANGAIASDVSLPNDLIEPLDLLATANGYVVAGALGDVVLVDVNGGVRARTRVDHNPEAGAIRLVPLPDGRLYLEELTGIRLRVDLSPEQIGTLTTPGFATAATYTLRGAGPNQVMLGSTAVSGPIATAMLSSPLRIITADVIWAREGEGAVAAIQEAQTLPEEATLIRIQTMDAQGKPSGEAYIGPEAFGCNTQRPFTRLTDGRVISISFRGEDAIAINQLEFVPIGKADPKKLGQASSLNLNSEDAAVLADLERLNGNPSISVASLTPISRKQILDRARHALELKWTLSQANFSHPNVPNLCNPPANIWRRPDRLDLWLGKEATAIPYRWGGYASTLDTFKTHLKNGRLAGDVCTCRNGNCVHPEATGLDCSGFVSYAWQTGKYFTTASLPDANVSVPILWSELSSGDIVNRSGSHVRLVESISSGPNGPLITVIESASRRRCGGVCRDTYLQTLMQKEKYRPLRRIALTN